MRSKLRERRKQDGKTLKDMEMDLDIDRSHFSSIETGRRVGSIPFWLKVQNYFGLSDAETWEFAKEGICNGKDDRKEKSKNKVC